MSIELTKHQATVLTHCAQVRSSRSHAYILRLERVWLTAPFLVPQCFRNGWVTIKRRGFAGPSISQAAALERQLSRHRQSFSSQVTRAVSSMQRIFLSMEASQMPMSRPKDLRLGRHAISPVDLLASTMEMKDSSFGLRKQGRRHTVALTYVLGLVR